MKTNEMSVSLDRFEVRPSGGGFEILADNKVIAWTMDGGWAIYLLGLLVEADEEVLAMQGE
jgi:hypothetical protein